MKRFSALMALALLVVAVAAMSCITVVPAAAADQNVIYISDNGTGDGSSPSSPLKAETRVENTNAASFITDSDTSNDYMYYSNLKLYENSVLYQAAEKLAKTGGEIVLVGDVVIDYSKTYAATRTTSRDFYMPDHGNNRIKITAQNGACLVITEGSYLNLNGETVFDDITIKTRTGRNSGRYCDYDLAICCTFNRKTVFGEGVTCVNECVKADGVDERQYYLSISGTKRYGDVTGDTNITINGGTWDYVYGGMFGNPGDVHRGDTVINVGGGHIKGFLVGESRDNNVHHYGNVEINVSGGTFDGAIYISNSLGTGYKDSTADVTITGGEFKSSSLIRRYTGTLKTGAFFPYTTVDLSSFDSADFAKKIEADRIIYPAKMVNSVTLKSEPKSGLCYLGEEYDAEGMVVAVSYTNGATAEIAYAKGNEHFDFSCDSSSEKSAVVTGTYGGKAIAGLNKTVNVIKTPVPAVIGAQISTENVNGGLRFVAEMQRSAEKYVNITDYGFIIWDGSVMGAETVEDFEKFYGGEKTGAFGKKFRAEYDELGYYNNDEKTTFSAVFDGIRVNDYEVVYNAVAYVVYEYNGEVKTEYSKQITRSVLEVAEKAIDSGLEDNDWIQANVIDAYEAYVEDTADRILAVKDAENAEMLRDEVMMELDRNMSFSWTPSTTFDLTEAVTVGGVTYSGSNKYVAGTKYYGMPYVTNSKAELSEFAWHVKSYMGTNVYMGPVEGVEDFYSATSGTYVEKEYNNIQTNKYKVDEKYYELTSFFPASDYYGMVVNIWNKVGTNKVWLNSLQSFIPAYGRGTVAVGGYDYTVSKNDTLAITQANGKDKMFAAYAQVKRGDVIMCYKNGGRSIYMVMEDAGSASVNVVTFLPEIVAKNGGYTHFKQQTLTFEGMYNSGYIPVTIPELAMGTQSRTAAYVVDFDGAAAMKSGRLNGKVLSNKQILSVTVKLSRFGEDGVFYDETVYCNSISDQNVNSFDLSEFDMSKYLVNLVEGKEYTLSVIANVANDGTRTLVSYKYTKPYYDLEGKYAYSYNGFNADFSNMEQTSIDLMKEQMNIYWTPATSFKYANLTGTTNFCPNTAFTAGTVYKGILYANTRATLGDFVSVLGSKTWNSSLGQYVYTLGSGDSSYQGTTDWNYVTGNHCSASMYHAYQQMIRLHASSRGNVDMRLLGLKDIYLGVSSYTGSLVKLYGAEAIYESYALAEKGDFVYKNSTGGHTRMVQEVNVVRDPATGRIDPEKSSILMLEQTDTLESEVYGKAANGTSDWTPSSGYDSTWWEHTYTFKLLATGNGAAIILRPTEFNTGESEKHYVGLTKLATKSELENTNRMGGVESNYPIIAVYATVKFDDGTVMKATDRALTGKNFYNLNSLFTSSADIYNGTPGRYILTSKLQNKSYTYTLEVELAIGKVVLQELKVSAS